MNPKNATIEHEVMCDEPGCGWTQKCAIDDVPAWHNKPCPTCGKGVIVSDDDMVVFVMVDAAMKLTDIIDPDGKMPRTTLHIDTAKLRTTKGQL